MTDSDRPGDLERYAVDCALYAAHWTHYCTPTDTDHDFLDYFEAAVTRNLGLLWGFETIAEDMDQRGIVPPSEGEQATLVTDGGEDTALPVDDVAAQILDSWTHRGGGWDTWTAPSEGYRVHVEMVDLEVPPDEVRTAFEIRLDDCREGRPFETVVRETVRNSRLALIVADELARSAACFADEWEEGLCPRPEEVGRLGQ